MSAPRPRIACVGPGRMGRGIAHVFAYAGYPVTVVDLKRRPPGDETRVLEAARGEVGENLRFLASLECLTEAQADAALNLVSGVAADGAAAALAAADVVFEAVPEVLDVKREVLGRIDDAVDRDAIIASTTSTIIVDTLASHVSNPSRFVNAHFLNPAFLIPLVEISAGETTDESVVARLTALLEAVGKVPVRCRAAPGYIVPRIQAAAMAEAARIVDEGVATPADIDRAIKAGFGPRYATLGLVEFIDWGGVDIMYRACNYLNQAFDTDRYTPPAAVEDMMNAGHRGLREGRGYYDFTRVDVAEYRRRRLTEFVAILRHLDLLAPPGV